jgi:hypothetical protein
MDRLLPRALVVLALLAVLGVLFVGYGATPPDHDRNDYPDERSLIGDYDAQIGEYVELSGPVVATDPVVIDPETPAGEPFELRIESVDEPVAEGENLRVFGTVGPDATIDAERTLVREPWESIYMYAVSVLAGGWVFVRFVRGWRLDTDEWAFVPREEPLRWGRH